MTTNLPLPPALQSWTPAAPLRLASGEMLAEATVGYQTWGELNAARDNVIWVCHALTASSDVASWWAGAFGPGRTLDPTRSYIVCANVLGSCYGSAGPSSLEPQGGQRYGAAFPELSVTDLVEHQRLLADHLGIRRIQLVVGASMGGFQVLEWARLEPVRVRRIALIATSWRQPPQALAQARLQCEFIRRDPKFKGGDYPPDDPPAEGLALARQLGHLTYRSAGELDQLAQGAALRHADMHATPRLESQRLLEQPGLGRLGADQDEPRRRALRSYESRFGAGHCSASWGCRRCARARSPRRSTPDPGP